MTSTPSTSTPSSDNRLETVNINFEDFNDNFLTCATCLCPFDEVERRAKLLSCSHSVCSICLHTIAQLPHSVDTGTFRCPICRAVHSVPRGGVSDLPPSYLVNQLMSLMQRQRRHVVPTCSEHSQEELLFCETCDLVFCSRCRDVDGRVGPCSSHTIVPFSTAIKRMSEIVLYKASQCVRNLDRALLNVQCEQDTLDTNVDRILDQINASFQDLSQLLDSRRRELVDAVRRTRDEKRRVLHEQLGIVQAEKVKVEQQCHGLGQCHQLEVHSITRKITALNDKLDTSVTLIEPRENAFLKYDSSARQVLDGIQLALAHFGTLSVSRTYPPLCTASLRHPCAVHVQSTVRVTTIDYNGTPRTTGGDPVHAYFVEGDKEDERVEEMPVAVVDRQDGTYDLTFMAVDACTLKLVVTIFTRRVRAMPLTVVVSEHHPPARVIEGRHRFNRPTRIAMSADGGTMYVLDTNNDRCVGLELETAVETTAIVDQSMSGGQTVGLAVNHLTNSALTLNWKRRTVTEHSLAEGHAVVRSFTFSELAEPIDIAVDSLGRVLIVDSRLAKVFVFDTHAKPLFSFVVGGGGGPKSPIISTGVMRPRNVVADEAAGANVTAVAIGLNDDILVAVGHEVLVYSSSGHYDRSIDVLPRGTGKGRPRAPSISIGGLCVDGMCARVLTTVTDTSRHSSSLAVSSYKGAFLFAVDSMGARLRRPSGVCLMGDGEHCLVADLANHQVKQLRYK